MSTCRQVPDRPTRLEIQQAISETDVLHPDAAGIDAGASEQFVAVGACRDPQSVRRFPTFTAKESLHLPDRPNSSIASSSVFLLCENISATFGTPFPCSVLGGEGIGAAI